MGRPIRLRDGRLVIAETKVGVELTPEDEAILAEFLGVILDRASQTPENRPKTPARKPKAVSGRPRQG